jgi:5-amino-6-(5-phosphoribosylamino)uracil reductase
MISRPYVLLSCAVSIDGYIDDNKAARLFLSNDADFDRVDAVRATADAILVGSTTIRKDNPRLLVRSQARRDERVRQGLTPTPTKITLTGQGDLDPTAQFFMTGDADKIVYAGSAAFEKAKASVGDVAQVVDGGDPIDLKLILADLEARGVKRLMVEGGGTVHTQFLTAGLADELHLVIAPFFIGNSQAARFAYDGTYPFNSDHRARLVEVAHIGDVALLRYALSERYPA